jgi:DNA-binding Lrp family transcriptional regulator
MLESCVWPWLSVPVLSDLDRRIVAALQIDGRAPWAAVASATGSTESTVARRAGRLLADGRLRIVGMVDPIRCGFGRTVLCQLRCEPGTVATTVAHLAGLPEVRFAATTTGTYDAIVELVVTSRADLARLLIHHVQVAPGVRDVVTAVVTRNFKVSYDWARPILGDAAAAVAAPVLSDEHKGQPIALDQVDLAVIAALRENGRRGYADIAVEAGVTEATAHRRVARLINTGCVVCGALIRPELLGFDVEALCWLRVGAAGLDQAVAALRARPEVRYLSATTGFADLACELVLPGYDDLYRFSTDVLGLLPGGVRVYTSVELMAVKRAFLPAAGASPGDQDDARPRPREGTPR